MNPETEANFIELKFNKANSQNKNDLENEKNSLPPSLKKAFSPQNIEEIIKASEAMNDIVTIDQKNKKRRTTLNHKKSMENHNCIENIINEEEIKENVDLSNEKFTHEIYDENNNKILIINEEEEFSQEYNPYLMPVNFELLEKHIKASKFGFHEEFDKFSEFDEFSKKILEEDREILKINQERNRKVKEIILEILWKVEQKCNSNESKKDLRENSNCPCCGETTIKCVPSLCFSSEDLRFLGYAYPLFMKILKSLIFFIGIPYIIIVFIPNIIFLKLECIPEGNEDWDLKINKFLYCDTGNHVSDLFVYYEIINKRMILDFIFSVYLCIVATGIRIYSLRYIKQFEHSRPNPISRMTVLSRHLPKDVQEEEIMDYFENFQIEKKTTCFCLKNTCDSKQKFIQKPVKVHYIYNLSDYLHVSEKIVDLINKRRKFLAVLKISSKEASDREKVIDNQSNLLSTFLTHIEIELKKIDKEIVEAHNKKSEIFQSLKQNPQDFFRNRFTGKAFIEFQDENFVKELLKIYNSYYDERRKNFKGENIYLDDFLEEAPSPEELRWENFGIPYKQKIILRIVIIILELVTIVICAFLVRVVYQNLEFEKFELEMGVGIIILLLNRILFWTIQKLVSMEKHKSLSRTEKRMICMSFTFFFVNIIVYELLGYLNFVFDEKLFEIDLSEIEDEEEFEIFESVIHKIFFVSIFLSLIEPILKFIFNYKHYVKVYKRHQVKKHPNLYCQKEAHEIFEGLEFELSEYYADFILIFVLGVLGAPFYPLSFLIATVGLILQYWLFKMNLIYFCKAEGDLCKKLINIFLKVINISPIFYILGVYFNAVKLLVGEYETSYNFNAYQIFYIIEIVLIAIICRLKLDKIVAWKLNVKKEAMFEKEESSERGYNQLECIFKHEK